MAILRSVATEVPERSSGRFWLSDEPEKIVGGWLDLSGRWPLVELAEPLVALWHEVSRTQQPDGSWVVHEEPADDAAVTVHGMLREGPRRVTLVSASDAGGNQVMGGVVEDPGTQRLRADYAVLGGHVQGPETLFRHARMRFEHLDVWAQLPGVKLEVSDDGSCAVLTGEQQSEERVVLRDPAGHLVLDSTFTMQRPTVRGGRLARSAELRWEASGQGLTKAELWERLVGPLSVLLTLAVDADSPPASLEVRTDDDARWLETVSPGLTPASDDVLAAGKVLLCREHLGMEALENWLAQTTTLSPVHRLVAEAVTSPGERTLESQLLELASAAEGLHRRLHPKHQVVTKKKARQARQAACEAVDEDVRERVQQALAHLDEPTYRDRLLALVEQGRPAVPGVIDRAEEWARRVADARNGFAHQLAGPRYAQMEHRLEEHVILLGSLRWLLTGLLLIQAGTASAVLAQRLEQHQAYRVYRQQAREWLPSVCSAGSEDRPAPPL